MVSRFIGLLVQIATAGARIQARGAIGYFAVAARLAVRTVLRPRDMDLPIVAVRLRAAKPAPNANRITGPNVFAAASPTK
jgi:hypothetical protein